MEGTGSDLLEILSWNLSGGPEENQDKFYSRKPVSQPRFKPATSRIEVRSVIA
jgi:hypothetical protein